MRFDFLSFVIGFAAAAVVAFIVYRLRSRLAAVRQTAESQAGSTRQFITNSSEGRYYGDLVKSLNAYHLAGDLVKLTDIYVEPRFVPAPVPADPTDEKHHGVFHVVPLIEDLPAAYAPYNIETLSINELRAGEPHLALLGLPGSGKSVALAIIGLVASGEIELETIDMMADEVFEDEIKDLAPADRDKMIQQRQDIQKRALEHLKTMQEKEKEKAKEEGRTDHSAVDFHRLLPILVHLRDIDLRPEAYGVQTSANGKGKPTVKKLDPAEPVVKALQRRSGTITANTLPRMVYNRLTAGTALVLIDGYEDIPPEERPEKLLWLRQFMELYGGNFIIVTGPATGYDPLVNLGLTPVFLRPWTDADFERLIQRWAIAWPTIAGTARRPAPMPEDRIIRRAATNNRGRLPLDITFKTWAAFAGDEQDVGRIGWYDFYVRQRFNNKDVRPALEKIAAAMLDQGNVPLTREKIKEIATAALTGPGGKVTTNVDDALAKLIDQSGLMVDWPGNRFGYAHMLLTAYLAGTSLNSASAEAVCNVTTNPAWEIVLPFAAARAPMDAAVTQRLASTPDLLFTSLFSLAPWLPDAPPNATWRAEVFKRFTAALLAASQYPAIRERAMAALVSSRDKNVGFIFRQALRSTEASVRRLGCIGLGALGETDAIKDLGPMLTDPDADVQLAQGHAEHDDRKAAVGRGRFHIEAGPKDHYEGGGEQGDERNCQREVRVDERREKWDRLGDGKIRRQRTRINRDAGPRLKNEQQPAQS